MPNFEVFAPRTTAGPARVVVTLTAAAGPADADAACETLLVQLRAGPPGRVMCDVSALVRSDLGTVDLICRLVTTARACGYPLVLRGVPRHLRSLLLFAGLGDAVPCLDDEPPGSVLEAER